MLLKVIIFLIVFYYLMKIIGRIFLPLFIANRVQKMEQNKKKAYSDYINKKKKEEGKVTIDGNYKTSSTYSNKGDYVDFEEIK